MQLLPTPVRPALRLRATLMPIALTAVLPAVLLAQTAPETGKKEEIIELSPFVVTSAEDTGYQATSTLAGSRIRTPLADVGTAVSVVTKQFMEDTQSTNLRDVLVYTTGTEVTGFGGNFSGAAATGGQQVADRAISNNPGTRIRGLAAAEITRHYFRTSIPFDSYNSGRLEINRGASAILFGVGSPAGIINCAPESAELGRTRGEARISADQFGTVRSEVDFNQSLWSRQAAIRLSALQDREKFQQEPAYNDDERGYVALTLSPQAFRTANGVLSGTTLRASGEWGSIFANNPRTLPPQDRVSQWFESPARFVQFGITPKATHNGTERFSESNGRVVTTLLTRSPILVFPDAATALATDALSRTGGAANVIGRQFASSLLAAGGVATAASLSSGRLPNVLARAGDPDAAFFVVPSITDTSIFDYRHHLLDGPNKWEEDKFDAKNLVLEQLLFKGRAGFELAYDRQNVTGRSRSLLGSEDTQFIAIDLNTVMIDGLTNPDFGRPFTSGSPFASYRRAEAETKRATAFGELDFKRIADGRLGRWLGRHTLSLLYQDEESFVENRSGRAVALAAPFAYGLNQSRFADSGKEIQAIHYLGDSLAARSTTRASYIPGIAGDRLDFAAIASGGRFQLRRQAANMPFELVSLSLTPADDYLTETANSAAKSLRTISSAAVNLQSYLLDDTLIATVGWRKEQVESSFASAPVNGADANRLVNDSRYALAATSDQEIEETLRSWSLVAKAPARWLRRVPGGVSFSLFYNESGNFSPPQAPRRSPFGDLLTAPTGETQDYGFNLGLFDGRANLRVNWYETRQTAVTNDTLTPLVGNILNLHRLAFAAVTDGFVPDANGDHFPDNYVAPPAGLLALFDVQINGNTLTFTNPGVAETSDFVSEGIELEFVMNLRENWTVLFNASQQQSVRTGSGETLRQLLYETPLANGRTLVETWPGLRIPLFSAPAQNPAATAGFLSTDFQNGILASYIGVSSQDNGPAQELRKWRFNGATNYRFARGPLKGGSVGLAARWQDKVAIGFPLTTLSGQRVIDATKPFYGPTEFNLDAWVGYERMLWKGKVKWHLQLNVRNLVGDQGLIPVQVQPTGEAAVYRIPEPRLWSLSSKFSF